MNSEWDQSSGGGIHLFQSRKVAMTTETRNPSAEHLVRQIVVLGPELIPADILEEGLLTLGDQRDIALDHITRTSDAVFHLRLVKRA
jgi:hypothetical protein